MIVNGLNFGFTISPELQSWIDLEITPGYISAGLDKMAIILPATIFAQVSVEQLIDEENTSQISTNYFDNEEDAFKWIKEQ